MELLEMIYTILKQKANGSVENFAIPQSIWYGVQFFQDSR